MTKRSAFARNRDTNCQQFWQTFVGDRLEPACGTVNYSGILQRSSFLPLFFLGLAVASALVAMVVSPDTCALSPSKHKIRPMPSNNS